MNSMPSTPIALVRICRVLSAVFIPIETKSSWSAAAGMDWKKAGGQLLHERVRQRKEEEKDKQERLRAYRQTGEICRIGAYGG